MSYKHVAQKSIGVLITAMVFAGCSGGGLTPAGSRAQTSQAPQVLHVNGHIEQISQVSSSSYDISVDGKLEMTNVFNADGSISHIWQNVSIDGKNVAAAHIASLPAKDRAKIPSLVCKTISFTPEQLAAQIQAVADAQMAYNSAIAADIALGISSIAIDAETIGLAEVLGLSAAQYAAVENTISAYDNLQTQENTLAKMRAGGPLCG